VTADALPGGGEVLRIGQTVMERVGIPKDRWEIAAQLEVMGFRDSDARERFGTLDLFEAADAILALFHAGKLRPAGDVAEREKAKNPVLQFLRFYFDGLMFSMPMVLQGCTMLLWGYGLWGAVDLDVRTGSAIALGFIGSYIVSSGFAWAIVRRGLFYFYQKEGGLARWSALRIWWISVRVVLALMVPALALNFVYEFLPLNLFLVALAYYAGLALLWLNWSLVYLVGRTFWLLFVLAVSIALVVFCARVLGWPIIAANMAGLVVADLLAFAVGLRGLNRWAREAGGKPAVNPPRVAVLVYSTAQVFFYGLLYSAFIFTDRILAWTSTRGREDFPPYPFWLNARYELGMDLGLIVVVLLAGVVEYTTQQFSIRLVDEQKRARSTSASSFLKEFLSFYRRNALVVTLCGVAAVGLASVAAELLRAVPDPQLQESLRSETTIRVFWLAAIAYAIFMLALQSILMLVILARVDLAVRAMAIAFAVNIAAGFVISRSVHYSGSVVGLLAGCIVLAVLGHRSVRRLLGDLDYYYYAAY
jgi:hypothetical protein